MSRFFNNSGAGATQTFWEKHKPGTKTAPGPTTAAPRTRPPGTPVEGNAIPRHPFDTVESLLGGTPDPPGIDPAAMKSAADLAAAKQRKRVAKYALLIEGQPEGKGMNPDAVLSRRQLLGY